MEREWERAETDGFLGRFANVLPHHGTNGRGRPDWFGPDKGTPTAGGSADTSTCLSAGPHKLGSIDRCGSREFQNNASLKSVTIPASVTSIGFNAFRNNASRKSVTFLGNAPQLTVSITTPPNKTGPLKATVTTNIGGSSGVAKQVAIVFAVL